MPKIEWTTVLVAVLVMMFVVPFVQGLIANRGN